tara:strand:- start:1087 stop:2358 length:1272 start_codon:yes stop_codon:yes gene_type:complete
MGKKGKKSRQDDDDFETAVQSLSVEDDPPADAEGQPSELDRVLERACGCGLLTETEFDALTDELASGALSEADLLAEWVPRLKQYDDAAAATSGSSTTAPKAAPAAPAAVGRAPTSAKNTLKSLASPDDLNVLIKEAGSEGIVVVMYTAAWCHTCKKIGPYFAASLPPEFIDVGFASVDVDACADMAERVGAEKLPLFDILRGGRRVDTIVGAQQTALRKKLLKLAPPPPPSTETAGGAPEAVGADAGGSADGEAGGAAEEPQAPKRENALVVIRSKADLDALVAEAKADAAEGGGQGLIVAVYADAANAACKKFAPVLKQKLPAEFDDVRFCSVDIHALPALAEAAGVEDSAEWRKDTLPVVEFLKNGKRVDRLESDYRGAQQTAIRDKVMQLRIEDDASKKKKKGRQAKVEKVAKGYTVGR